MNERLTVLKIRAGLKWGELAKKLGISVGYMGFLRRGERRVTPKILEAIEALEAATGIATPYGRSQVRGASNSYGTPKEDIQTILQENVRLREENASLRGEVQGLRFALEKLVAKKK